MNVRLFALSAVLSTMAGVGLVQSAPETEVATQSAISSVVASSNIAEATQVSEVAISERGVSAAAPAPATGSLEAIFGRILGLIESIRSFISSLIGG